MKTAQLKIAPNGDKLRFEVISPPTHSKPNSTAQKWFIKANHRVEASRWTQAIQQSMEWARRGAGDDEPRRRSGESENTSVKKPTSIRSMLKLRKTGQNTPSTAMESSSSLQDTGNESIHSNHSNHTLGTPPVVFVERPKNDDDSMIESTGSIPPHDEAFELHANATTAQIHLTSQLLSGLQLPEDTPQSTTEIRSAVKDSLAQIQDMVSDYVRMTNEREQWWCDKIRKEQERQAIWEESLHAAVKEGEVLENELRSTMGRRASRRLSSAPFGGENTAGRRRPSHGQATIREQTVDSVTSYFPTAAVALSAAEDIPETGTEISAIAHVQTESLLTPTPERVLDTTAGPDTPRASLSVIDTDEEDEFFDAIDEGSIANMEVPEALQLPTSPVSTVPPAVNVDQYAAYRHLRDRLSIGNDNRPNTSLWSVLKNSIGKDLTKISFPVSFNEPTSMLQRMVNLLLNVFYPFAHVPRLRTWNFLSVVSVFVKFPRIYSDYSVVDAAAQDQDPLRRIAFVAAFAMSNYSSTIGR